MTTSTLSAPVYTDNQYAIKNHHHSIQSNGNLIIAEQSAKKFVTDKLMLNSGTMHNPHSEINILTQMTGQTVGAYTVKDRLGGSAYSAVYRAYSNLQNRSVALKVLMPDADQVTRRRFRQEALTTLDLNHPNIVHTYEADQIEEGGLFYISMEYIDGPSLADFMEEQRHLCLADAANLLEPIARALAYAHSKGIVHRDVKPSNILLKRVPEGTEHSIQLAALDYPVIPLLSDFGIARVLDLPELTNTGRTIGTPAYMAPEQCAGNRQIDGRADIYSLGTVLYRCLVGHPPFVGTTTQILYAHVYEPLTIPDEMVDKLPGRAVRMLKRMLTKDPEHRYRHIGQLADDLAVIAGRLGAKRNLTSPVNKSVETETMSTVSSVGPNGHTATSVLVPAPQPRTIVNAEASALVMMPTTSQDSFPQQKAQQNRPVTKRQMPGLRNNQRLSNQRSSNWHRYANGATGAAAAAIVLVFLLGYYTIISLGLFTSNNPTTAQPTGAYQGTYQETAPEVIVDNGTVQIENIPAGATALLQNAEVAFSQENWPSAYDALYTFYTQYPQLRDEQKNSTFFTVIRSYARQLYVEQDILKAKEIISIAHNFNIAYSNSEKIELEQLANATQNYLNARDENAQAVAMNTILNTYVSYSDALFASQDYCNAYTDMESTLELVPPKDVHRYQGRLSDYNSRCKGRNQESPLLVDGDGAIEVADMAVPVRDAGTGGVVMSPDIPEQRLVQKVSGRILYTAPAQGVRHAMAVGLGPKTDSAMTANLQTIVLDQHILRFSQFIQDETMRHVRWNPAENRIAYTAQREGILPQIYLAETQLPGQQPVLLAAGQEPAWNQRGDLIAYSGFAESGGIWQVYLESGQSNRLTENVGDRHPVWTPDNNAIVFMSNGRDGNWELYIYNRLGAAGQQITRLTNDAAIDGLPAVSPDGEHIAFLSDRGGKWQVWVMSLEAGKIGNYEAEVLFDVAGQMTDWTQETIQWVP